MGFPAGHGVHMVCRLRAARRGAGSRRALAFPAGKGSAGPAEVAAFPLAAQVEREAKK